MSTKLYHFFTAITLILFSLPLLTGCIEDGVTTSPADQPVFSTDTLRLGSVFTGEGTPTHSFKVYNRHDKILSISEISFTGESGSMFRANVDGLSGTSFRDIEIRPNDSIYVFIEATIPPAADKPAFDVMDALQFTVNGVTSKVVLTARGCNFDRLQNRVITSDTTLRADLPHRIFDTLTVAQGVTLTLEAGAELYIHDKAFLRIEGTLRSLGSARQPVLMRGDRTGIVAADIPYEVMSRQWEGVLFTSTSRNNRMEYTVIENTVSGVTLDSLGTGMPEPLQLVNCRLRNSHGYVLDSRATSVSATGTEFAEAASGLVHLAGGFHTFSYCTFANNYLFTYPWGAAIQFEGDIPDDTYLQGISATITNSIIYGLGPDLSHLDLSGTDIYLERCIMRSAGTDDDHFLNILWDTDPLFLTDRQAYLFDYRLSPDSPALMTSDPTATPSGAQPLPATDFYGAPRTSPAAIGAMESATVN